MSDDPGTDKESRININQSIVELTETFTAKFPFTVIDFNSCRIERDLAERGITIKKNMNNQVKIFLRLGGREKK